MNFTNMGDSPQLIWLLLLNYVPSTLQVWRSVDDLFGCCFCAVVLLMMDNVNINNIESGALRGLTQLEELNLSHNNISEIQDGTFDGLFRLKKLLMVGNKLTTLKSLKGLTSLQWLDVDRNNIATIDDDAFKDTRESNRGSTIKHGISLPCWLRRTHADSALNQTRTQPTALNTLSLSV
ncbi:Leucine-rich repeat-containing G protein-coupled receptor 3 [Carabus blaptoides fortunei]